MATSTTTIVPTTTTFASCAVESDAAHAEVFDFAALYRAWLACRRGKSGTRKAQRYEIGLLDNLVDTAKALQTHAWRPSHAIRFVTLQPKPREILASEFGDRVVHHVLVPWLEARYEPVFIHDSFANRKGRGTHAAVHRLRGFLRRDRKAFYLQLDVANFFNSINRRSLFGLLRGRLQRDLRRPASDPRHVDAAAAGQMLWLARVLLTGNAAQRARFQGRLRDLARVPAHKQLGNAPVEHGLPIGNLSSQFFANVYLNELDQFIKHQLKVRHYLRYVDDFVLVHADPTKLLQWHSAIADFLQQRLGLALRDAGKLAPVADGIDFLGYVIRADYCLVRRRVVAHLHDRLCQFRRQMVAPDGRAGCTPARADQLQAMLASYFGHFSHARSQGLRQRVFARHPWLAHWLQPVGDSGLRRVDRPDNPDCLADQWRYFRQRYPRHALLVQVGNRWECDAGPAARRTTQRPGLPPTQSVPAWHLPGIKRYLHHRGQAWCEVVEHGHLHNGRKRRQLRAVSADLPANQPANCFNDDLAHYRARSRRPGTVSAAKAAPSCQS